MRYYKRRWEDTRGDEYADWGHSWWYFEVDQSDRVVRQVEVYDDGTVLKYSQATPEDQHGGLSAEFNCEAMASFAIAAREFDDRWQDNA